MLVIISLIRGSMVLGFSPSGEAYLWQLKAKPQHLQTCVMLEIVGLVIGRYFAEHNQYEFSTTGSTSDHGIGIEHCPWREQNIMASYVAKHILSCSPKTTSSRTDAHLLSWLTRILVASCFGMRLCNLFRFGPFKPGSELNSSFLHCFRTVPALAPVSYHAIGTVPQLHNGQRQGYQRHYVWSLMIDNSLSTT